MARALSIGALYKQRRKNGSVSSIALLAISLVLLLAADLAHAQSTTQSAYLTPHNSARSQVGVSAVVWNVTLASYATSYAQSQVSKCTPLTHSGGPYGENLFWGSGNAWTPQKAVGYWVDEKAYYNHTTNTCAAGKVCGHYTQVVWKATSSIGCASVTCSDASTYIICSYWPRGNYNGQSPY